MGKSLPTSMSTSTSAALVAAIAVLLAVPATYALLRAYDVVFDPPFNPAMPPGSAHIAMFWRLSVAGYAAGMVAPVAYFVARRWLVRTAFAISTLALVVAAMVMVQGLALP
jgi:hypothetical protein